MLKKFVLRQALKSQLKNIPAADKEKILAVMSENPEFFQSVAAEIEVKVKSGKDHMAATLEVMQAHCEEFARVMGALKK